MACGVYPVLLESCLLVGSEEQSTVPVCCREQRFKEKGCSSRCRNRAYITQVVQYGLIL